MADAWPDTSGTISTANFDADGDNVSGASGARADLEDLINLVNDILAAGTTGAKVYSESYKSTIAFKDVINTFTERVIIQSYSTVQRDVSSAEKTFYRMATIADTRTWDIGILRDADGNALVITNEAGVKSLRINQNSPAVTIDAAGIKYGSNYLQTKLTSSHTSYSFTYSSANLHRTFTHNVGVHPSLIVTRIRCTTADAGYSVGMTIDPGSTFFIYSDSGSNSSGNIRGISVYNYNTNVIGIRIGNAGIGVMNRSTGTNNALTYGRWAIDVDLYWL